MVIIRGDTHGHFTDVARFCSDAGTTKDDLFIILGDAGINYLGGVHDHVKKQVIADIPVTVFATHGNHEQRPESIPSYHLIDFCGGKAYVEDEFPSIIFAKDGEIYDLQGRKTLVIGGAYSPDKSFRLATNRKWWPDEQPSEETKRYVEEVLVKNNWRVDMVLSHTCPFKYIPWETFTGRFINVDTSTEQWINTIEDRLDYDRWYCGHFHIRKDCGKLVMLYSDAVIYNAPEGAFGEGEE